MCSVSWFLTPDGYQLFFNRDEQKSRALAHSPRQFEIDGVSVLMPIDPVGQGSWISLNEYGVSLCLLNNYQGKEPSGPLTSRGQLVRMLSGAVSAKQVTEWFQQILPQQFAPFTLLAFDTQVCSGGKDVTACEWDGEKVRIYPTRCPLFSSGIDLKGVQAYRHSAYHQHLEFTPTFQNALDFHRNHAPDSGHLSVCMHREDAHTVSFTHISVSNTHKEMVYIPGSPCCELSEQSLTTHRYSLNIDDHRRSA
ncbi:NRDE family protein [Vibrio mangrovi]|uniref:NRDE family protein n=1 Tax=Vibrio mangrovi TaxID=474394 RepID=A0A1Y6ITR3_9VIBR|nr:NRDE family protein [Vibrio mangrovi]MDW6004754.1 NRDE family protein [Vibrio mangrovi]SMS01045.1 hypothetical protein VIM7927_02322 [Vibrio mangrovi]